MPPTAQVSDVGQAGLLRSLQDIRQRVKLYAVAFGVGVVIAAAIALALVAVVLDYFMHLPAVPRLLVLLIVLGGVGYAAFRWLLKPALAKLSIGDVAGRLEHAFPQFEDRLRSTVDFARGDYVPGSDPMKRRTIQEAEARARAVDLNSVVVARPVWYAAAGGIGAVAIVVALLALVGRPYRDAALSRFFNPFSDQPWPKSVEIQLVGDVPQRVPVGQRLDVQMKLAKGDRASRKAVIFYRYDNGPWQKELMTRGADGNYTASLDTRIDSGKDTGTLQVRMESGDDVKPLTPITVVPRLDIRSIAADVKLPPYAGALTSSVDLTERPAVMPVGSDVELRIHFNKPLDPKQAVAIKVSRGDAEGDAAPVAVTGAPKEAKAPPVAPQIKWDRVGADVAVARFAASESFRFSVSARDQDGFENTAVQEYELIVREDGMPTVQIEEPRRSMDRTPTAAFPLKAVAEDDYGIAAAQLVVQRVGEKSGPPQTQGQTNKWVIDLIKGGNVATPAGTSITWEAVAGGGGERERYRLEYLWDLSKLENANLKPGDVLEYFIQVRDNFDLNGKQHDFVSSGKLRVTIISPERAMEIAQIRAEQIAQEIKQIKLGQTRTKGETQDLAKQATERGKFDEADRTAAERLANNEATTASTTKQAGQKLNDLVNEMKENKLPEAGLRETAEKAAKQLENTAEGEMKEATKNLNEAKENKPGQPDPKADPKDPKAAEQMKQDAQARAQNLNKSGEQQAQAEQNLQKAMEDLGDFNTISSFKEKFQQLRDEQQKLADKFNENAKNNIGKKPEELSPEARQANEKLAEEQKKLQERTTKALADMDKKADQSKNTDPAKSQSMKQAAQAGSKVPSDQSKSQQSMQQNQQAAQQQSQAQIDLGLEMVLRKLKEAERRELQELVKKLAEIQQLVDELVRRQAGHNLDTLTLDDPKKFTAMTKEEQELLLAQAQREADKLPPPPAMDELTRSQEQTERNARDVAKTAEALPDPTPAAKLTAAAGHMERAIVHLRAGKLADAYDPPQVEALNALVDAQAAVDKALQEAQDREDAENQERIREAYVKLLDDQKKLDTETKVIDASRDAAGNLPRDQGVRLGQLPGEQGGLMDRAKKLGELLESLDSIVYVWANNDIVKSMDEVKADLAKPETGKPTQAEQTRIEEQLWAMIENLKQTMPRKSPFAQRNQGGGGQGAGQQPPRVPSEAELRLMKALQQAVNKSTKTIDAEEADKAKQGAKEKLLALGGRQGELRGILDQLLQQASKGKLRLGEEKKDIDPLPEEADDEDIENQEIDSELLGEDPTGDEVGKQVNRVGDRMSRSRERLAEKYDPGKTTQKIQDRIIIDLDDLIKLAQNQQQQQQQAQAKGRGGKPMKPQDGQGGKGQQQVAKGQGPSQQPNGSSPADQSSLSPGGEPAVDTSKDIKELMKEWGGITARERDAITEGQGEQPIEKYKDLIEDYYRSVAEKAAQR